MVIVKIITGNFILNENSIELKSRIDKINAMDAEQLRAYYLDKLNTTEISEKGGAGLGMIDLVRKSGNKIEYRFDDVNEQLSFFSLIINID